MLKQYTKYTGLFLITYLYIFAPPLRQLPFNPIKFLIILSLIYVSINKQSIKFLKFYKIELSLMTIIFLYSMIRGIFSAEIRVPYSNILIVLEVFLPSYCLVSYYSNNFTQNFVKMLIIPVLVLSSIISIYLFLTPELNKFIKYDILKFDIEVLGKFNLRGFGFGDELLYGYSLVHGIGCALCLVYLSKNIYLVLPALILLFPVVLNARIGFMPVLIGLLLSFRTINFRSTFIPVVIVLFMMTYSYLLPSDSEFKKAIEWSTSFFTETSNLLHGSGEGSNYDILFKEMIVLPATIGEWFYGKGTSIFLDQDGNSDIGYILQLNYGGIPYLTLFMLLIVYMSVRVYRHNVNWFAYFMFLVIMLGNIKGDIMSPKPAFRLIILLYSYFLLITFPVIRKKSVALIKAKRHAQYNL